MPTAAVSRDKFIVYDRDLMGIVEFYTSTNCTGAPSDVFTTAPSDCINVSQKFSYQAICS